MTEDDGLSKLRLVLGALVVLAGVLALLGALEIVMSDLPACKGTDCPDRATSVVTVITPVVAAIAAIVGLYFGVSASGSARGQEAQTAGQVAKNQEKVLEMHENLAGAQGGQGDR